MRERDRECANIYLLVFLHLKYLIQYMCPYIQYKTVLWNNIVQL